MDELGLDPRPRGVEKLSGHPDFLRIRVGDYRIVYAVPGANLLIVCTIRDRKDAYRVLGQLQATLTRAMQEAASDDLSRSLMAWKV